jgi:DNA mismatch repair protein MSH4
MMIDISTVRALELIQNLQDPKSKHCLFGLLNQTMTPMGARMLRSNILQPSTQIEQTLTPRYDALDELTVKEDMFFEIRTGKDSYTLRERMDLTHRHSPQEIRGRGKVVDKSKFNE